MTETQIKVLASNFQKLRESASRFVDKKMREKGERRTSDADEISFDTYAGTLTFSYEYNSACHCHPEMKTAEEVYPISEFVKWLSENAEVVELSTEADWV